MGPQRVGGRNENYERPTNLCVFNKIIMVASIFLHKLLHKATCVSTDCTTHNHIDHIYITKRSSRSIGDVRTKRGADVASNYHLVIVKMKLMSKKKKLDNWGNNNTEVSYSLKRSIQKRGNYCGEQMETDQISTNFDVSGGCGSQQASS